MKRHDERLEKLERSLREAHRARPEREPEGTWRRALMAEIRAHAAARTRAGAEDVSAAFRSVVRIAPAFASAAAILFVCGWILFFGAYDEVALTMLTGGLELPVLGF